MRRLALLLLLVWGSTAAAVQPGEQLADPALEHRARAISAGLRCLVCQNQSIDDSDAPLAADLRVLVRHRLSAGDTDEQVRQYLVARYGDFVLLRPRFRAGTLLLWLTPLIVLIGGGALAMRQLRGKPPLGAAQPLSASEEEEVARLTQGRD